MTATERYEKVWNGFLTYLQRHPHARLAPYLESQHVYHRGFKKWMYSHGYSVSAAKNRIRLFQEAALAEQQPTSCENTGAMFLPVEISCGKGRPQAEGLCGISLTMPDGTVVSIRKGSPEAVVSFIRLYSSSGEGMVCSD